MKSRLIQTFIVVVFGVSIYSVTLNYNSESNNIVNAEVEKSILENSSNIEEETDSKKDKVEYKDEDMVYDLSAFGEYVITEDEVVYKTSYDDDFIFTSADSETSFKINLRDYKKDGAYQFVELLDLNGFLVSTYKIDDIENSDTENSEMILNVLFHYVPMTDEVADLINKKTFFVDKDNEVTYKYKDVIDINGILWYRLEVSDEGEKADVYIVDLSDKILVCDLVEYSLKSNKKVFEKDIAPNIWIED